MEGDGDGSQSGCLAAACSSCAGAALLLQKWRAPAFLLHARLYPRGLVEPCAQQGVPTTEKVSAFVLGGGSCPEVTAARRSRPLPFTEAASSFAPTLHLPSSLPLHSDSAT